MREFDSNDTVRQHQTTNGGQIFEILSRHIGSQRSLLCKRMYITSHDVLIFFFFFKSTRFNRFICRVTARWWKTPGIRPSSRALGRKWACWEAKVEAEEEETGAFFFFPPRVHPFSARLIDSDQVKARRRWNWRKISSKGISIQPAGPGKKGVFAKEMWACVCGCVWRLQKKTNSRPVKNALWLCEYTACTVNTSMSLSV